MFCRDPEGLGVASAMRESKGPPGFGETLQSLRGRRDGVRSRPSDDDVIIVPYLARRRLPCTVLELRKGPRAIALVQRHRISRCVCRHSSLNPWRIADALTAQRR